MESKSWGPKPTNSPQTPPFLIDKFFRHNRPIYINTHTHKYRVTDFRDAKNMDRITESSDAVYYIRQNFNLTELGRINQMESNCDLNCDMCMSLSTLNRKKNI